MAPSNSPAYAKDEKVLCFHHDLLYEAKVLESKPIDPNDRKSSYHYRIHYKGWKNTWDDWVPQDRLRKLNDESKELAANLKNAMEESRALHRSSKSGPTSHKKKLPSDVGSMRGSEERATAARGQKRGRDFDLEKDRVQVQPSGSRLGPKPTESATRPSYRPKPLSRARFPNLIPTSNSSHSRATATPPTRPLTQVTGHEQEEVAERRPVVRIFFPDTLKEILVDDWEKVTKNMQLVPLPSATPVSYILERFFAEEIVKRREGSADADILQEISQGIVDYFNRAVGKLLLYRFEREQLREMYGRINSGTDEYAGKTLSDVYGAEHLCRLLVSFPELIAQTNMDAPSVERFKREISILITWLNKNIPTYFSVEYVNPPQQYIDQFMG